MGLREKKAARTREQILDAAAELFIAQGYDETTMEQIAESVEIAPSTLYRYFPSKDLLVLGRLTESLQLADALHARPEDEPLPDALAATLQAALTSLHDDPRFVELRHIIDASPVPRARLWDVLMQSRRELEKELASRMARDEGDIAVLLTAGTLMTLFEVAAERWWAGDHAADRGELVIDVLERLNSGDVVLPQAPDRSKPAADRG